MGWERKRGKIEEIQPGAPARRTPVSGQIGSLELLPSIRYC
jgi:hypothetical protein